jgi:hypothetical protein
LLYVLVSDHHLRRLLLDRAKKQKTNKTNPITLIDSTRVSCLFTQQLYIQYDTIVPTR